MVKAGGGKPSRFLPISYYNRQYFFLFLMLLEVFGQYMWSILASSIWYFGNISFKNIYHHFFILNRSRWISLDPFRYFISPLFCVNRIWVFSVWAGDTPWQPDTSWLIIFPQHWYLSNYHQPWKLITAFFVIFFY